MATGATPEFRYCSQCGQPTQLEELARFGETLICPNCKVQYVQKLREGVPGMQPVLRYAGFWIRFLAVLIDGIILAVVGGAVQLLVLGTAVAPIARFRPNANPDEAFAAFGAVLGSFALVGLINSAIASCYEAFFVSRVGATPGKMVCSLKVVRPDGGPVSLGRAFGRYFAKWLSAMILLIGYIIAAFDGQKRALHDMICDTRVIKAGETAPTYPRI